MVSTIARVLLEWTGAVILVIGTGIVMHKKFMVINWISPAKEQAGLDTEKLAKCVCGRAITRCLHEQGAGETWDHLDDGTHWHYDAEGLPFNPVEHR